MSVTSKLLEICEQEFTFVIAHFQLEFVIVSRLKYHVICYKSSPHWLKVTDTANQCASQIGKGQKKDLKQSRR